MQLEPKLHIISKGETLEKIASANRLPSWRSIYNANCNYKLRLLRPNPGKVQVGDRVFIPPKASDLALYRLQKLEKLRSDTDASFKSILSDWDRQYQRVKRVSNSADTAAEIALIFMNLSKLCLEGHKIMKLEGEALAKATNSFVKSFAVDKTKSLAERTIKATNFTDVNGDESTALLLTKVVVQSWFDMTTPSYWAQRFSGVDIEATNRNTKAEINRQQQAILQQLDQRILEVQRELQLSLQNEKNVLP